MAQVTFPISLLPSVAVCIVAMLHKTVSIAFKIAEWENNRRYRKQAGLQKEKQRNLQKDGRKAASGKTSNAPEILTASEQYYIADIR
jgi:hypothetical protein